MILQTALRKELLMDIVNENIINNPYHIYDNAFLSACSWDKRLLIPLINEIFDKNISENADIDHFPNEFLSHKKTKAGNDQLVKRITDALVRVDGDNFHFECESKNDGEILIRIADYDMQISLNDAKYHNHNVRVRLPDTAVIFLRNHRYLPGEGTVTYTKGGNFLIHRIPYFEICDYSLDYLAEKHLYILMPFYLMRYEHAITNNTSSKFLLIENEANKVYNILTSAHDSGILSTKEYEDIITLSNDIVKEISKGSQLNERLVKIMGNEVLKTAEERGEERGIEKGIFKATLENIRNAMESFKLSFDEACDGLKVRDREQYKKYIL